VSYHGPTGQQYWGCAWRTNSSSAWHSEGWRELSHERGDTMADILCRWCDTRPDPQRTLDALRTIVKLKDDPMACIAFMRAEDPDHADEFIAQIPIDDPTHALGS